MLEKRNSDVYFVAVEVRISEYDVAQLRRIKTIMGIIDAIKCLKWLVPQLSLREAKEIVESL